jgi:hypothetical protein
MILLPAIASGCGEKKPQQIAYLYLLQRKKAREAEFHGISGGGAIHPGLQLKLLTSLEYLPWDTYRGNEKECQGAGAEACQIIPTQIPSLREINCVL